MQKSLLGRPRHRCHQANPSNDKIARGTLPPEDELLAFEASYAGPQTSQLMERHSGESIGRSVGIG